MPSRRALLAGGAALALGGVGTASQVRLGPVESWAPPADTWPLVRYGPANTAANPAASVPADPGVAWRQNVLGDRYSFFGNASDFWASFDLVVGRDAVYVGDVDNMDGLVALDRRDGSVRWRDDELGGPIALHDGTLYVDHYEGTSTSVPPAALFALDAADGIRRWHADYGFLGGGAVVPTGQAVLLGAGNAIGAVGGDGGRRWTAYAEGSEYPTGVAVGDGAVFASLGDSVVRFNSRSLLEAGLGDPPPSAWVDPVDDPHVPAVADGRVVVGTRVEVGADRPAVVAYDPATGERVGGALRPADVPVPPDAEALVAATPAVVGDRAAVPYSFVGEFGDYDPPTAHGVVDVSLADGSVEWPQPVAEQVWDLAAAGDAVVVGTGPFGSGPDEAPKGTVLALSRSDGSERWRVDLGRAGAEDFAGASSVAPVDGAVFAVTDAGDVVALR